MWLHDVTAMAKHVWTVSEAKARLSEILRLASTEGPQRIGSRERYVVVPEAVWQQHTAPRAPLGRWLVEHVTAGEPLHLPDRRDPPRAIPFDPADDA